MKKRSCYLLVLVMLVLTVSLCGQGIVFAAQTGKINICRLNEFIDIDQNVVKFLFETTKGATVDFYLGEDASSLKVVKTVKNFDFKKGLKVDKLTPGKTYYYKIVSKIAGETKESEVLSFQKLENTDTTKKSQWPRQRVFEEIFVRSFADGNGDGIGDFKGLKEKLGYLKELGIGGLWLMPCFDSPSYHGYDVTDYYNIEPDFGTMQDFEDFLQEAHKYDIKVIVDLVINHSSSQHKWFVESAKGEASQYRDYYMWRDPFDKMSERGPWGQQVWYTYENGEEKPPYFYAVFWDGMPDLNLRNPKVREEVKNIAKFWLDKGLDGFRLDAAMHIDSRDSEVSHNWWQEFNAYVKSVNPEAFLVGENWITTDIIAPFYKDLDSSFNFPLSDMLLNMARGNSSDIVANINDMHKQYAKYSKDFIDTTFLSNHDTNRVGSVLIGNKEKEKLAASLLLTLPGTPFLYYGEELGQLGSKPDENIREPMDWYAGAKGPGMVLPGLGNVEAQYTIANDGISVQEEENDSDSLLNHYKKLIKIRTENPIFFTGEYKTIKTVEGTYGYKVSGQIIVIHNLTNKNKQVKVQADSSELLSGKFFKKNSVIAIKPYGTVIFK